MDSNHRPSVYETAYLPLIYPAIKRAAAGKHNQTRGGPDPNNAMQTDDRLPALRRESSNSDSTPAGNDDSPVGRDDGFGCRCQRPRGADATDDNLPLHLHGTLAAGRLRRLVFIGHRDVLRVVTHVCLETYTGARSGQRFFRETVDAYNRCQQPPWMRRHEGVHRLARIGLNLLVGLGLVIPLNYDRHPCAFRFHCSLFG